jgi:hypothetical protein
MDAPPQEPTSCSGVPHRTSQPLATTTLASVGGALILCRAEKSVLPLEMVSVHLRQLAKTATPPR